MAVIRGFKVLGSFFVAPPVAGAGTAEVSAPHSEWLGAGGLEKPGGMQRLVVF